MNVLHFCCSLASDNGVAEIARRFVEEERSRGDASALTDSLRMLRQAKPLDVVHVHGGWRPALWKAVKIARMKGARTIVHPSGSYSPVCLRFSVWKKRLAEPFERAKLRLADAVVATCAEEAGWIRAYEPRAKVERTDLKRFYRLPAAGGAPLAWTNHAKVLRLLYLGRRHPLKGVEYLEQAVRAFKGRVELRIESQAFGVDKDEAFDWCDALVLPTLSENFGIVVAEALERGRRVITTDGAPAWEPPSGDVDFAGMLTYVRGFREESDGARVELLTAAIERLVAEKGARTAYP